MSSRARATIVRPLVFAGVIACSAAFAEVAHAGLPGAPTDQTVAAATPAAAAPATSAVTSVAQTPAPAPVASAAPTPAPAVPKAPAPAPAPVTTTVKAAAPVTNTVQNVAAPVTNTVQKAAAPVTTTVQKAAAPVTTTVQDVAAPVTNTVQNVAAPVTKAVQNASAPVINAVPAAAVTNVATQTAAGLTSTTKDVTPKVETLAQQTTHVVGAAVRDADRAVPSVTPAPAPTAARAPAHELGVTAATRPVAPTPPEAHGVRAAHRPVAVVAPRVSHRFEAPISAERIAPAAKRASAPASNLPPSLPPIPGASFGGALAGSSSTTVLLFGLLGFLFLLVIPNAVRWLRTVLALGLSPAYVALSDRPG
jgi:hypothetical protein